MSTRAKLIASIRDNPKDVRFEDACRVAGWLGFAHRGSKGSHCTYVRPGQPKLLNFQNRKGLIPAYQARQLIEMIDFYWNDDE